MARTNAVLPPGSRIIDHISLGVIAKYFPSKQVNKILLDTSKVSIRQRDLPAHVVVYYVCFGALHAVVVSRGAALPAGRYPVVARPDGAGKSCGKIEHLAGEEPLALETIAAAVLRGALFQGLDGALLQGISNEACRPL